jgi:hypothetical protein
LSWFEVSESVIRNLAYLIRIEIIKC